MLKEQIARFLHKQKDDSKSCSWTVNRRGIITPDPALTGIGQALNVVDPAWAATE